MTFQNFTFDIDADGIALVTWNMPGRSMNVIDAKATEELAAIAERVATEDAIKGAVLTSGKDAFCGGADLTMLETLSRTFAELTKSAKVRLKVSSMVRSAPPQNASLPEVSTAPLMASSVATRSAMAASSSVAFAS